MRNLFAKLWADDAGVVTIEYLVLGVFLAIALIVGVATLSAAINNELAEFGRLELRAWRKGNIAVKWLT